MNYCWIAPSCLLFPGSKSKKEEEDDAAKETTDDRGGGTTNPLLLASIQHHSGDNSGAVPARSQACSLLDYTTVLSSDDGLRAAGLSEPCFITTSSGAIYTGKKQTLSSTQPFHAVENII
eukprot:1194446-Prorocentrum_minimum.AAC.4